MARKGSQQWREGIGRSKRREASRGRLRGQLFPELLRDAAQGVYRPEAMEFVEAARAELDEAAEALGAYSILSRHCSRCGASVEVDGDAKPRCPRGCRARLVEEVLLSPQRRVILRNLVETQTLKSLVFHLALQCEDPDRLSQYVARHAGLVREIRSTLETLGLDPRRAEQEVDLADYLKRKSGAAGPAEPRARPASGARGGADECESSPTRVRSPAPSPKRAAPSRGPQGGGVGSGTLLPRAGAASQSEPEDAEVIES